MAETLSSLVLDADRVHAWGELTADGNPLHTDPTFASRTRFGTPIVHGHLLVCVIAEALYARFGPNLGRVSAKFRRHVPVGSRVDIVWDKNTKSASLMVTGIKEPAVELSIGRVPATATLKAAQNLKENDR